MQQLPQMSTTSCIPATAGHDTLPATSGHVSLPGHIPANTTGQLPTPNATSLLENLTLTDEGLLEVLDYMKEAHIILEV